AAPEHRILVSGGAILGMPAWLQIVADTLGQGLTALASDDETTARGAALMAATESGLLSSLDDAPAVAASATIVAPNLAHHERYRAGRERQARLERALIPTGEFV
ncbi:MAG: FGGY-family carbohydrate kinase, partial [Thermomicrobiales bacterium]